MEIVLADIGFMLAVAGSGIYTGVMLVIGLTLGPWWISLEPRTYAMWFRDNFTRLVTPLSLGLIPAVVGAVLSIANAPASDRGIWWAVLISLGVGIVLTLAYHVPANFRIWSLKLNDEKIRRELRRWLVSHAFRVASGLVATILAATAPIG